MGTQAGYLLRWIRHYPPVLGQDIYECDVEYETMRAAVFDSVGEPLAIENVETPSPTPGGAVIETEACGVCRSDWHAWQGHWDWLNLEPSSGQIFGHEPAGRVIEVGDEVEDVREGDHVAVPFNFADGQCPECMTGHSNVCENITPLGFTKRAQGAFAEQVKVPNADFNLVPLPDNVTSKDMAGLGCRFVTSFHALAHVAPVSAGDWVAVHGCGGIGLSAVHIADALGANVIAVDISDEKLSKAAKLGATDGINASDTENVVHAIHALTGGGADISLDALGHAETSRNSIHCLRRRGDHVQIGLTSGEEQGNINLPTDKMVLQEKTFHGSAGMPTTSYDEIFNMVSHGELDPGKIISRSIPLEDVSQTLESMTDYETIGISVIDEF
jgi:alcohol dehydrogenase